jgi:hypothetical protein
MSFSNFAEKLGEIVKPDAVQDFTKSSEFFDDPNIDIKKELEKAEAGENYITWIQSFSKRIVTITFCLYLVVNMVVLFICIFSTLQGGADISTLYAEINETFRVVIGGYLIKAGIENAFKISGNYYVGIANAKLKMLKEKLGQDTEECEDQPVDFSTDDY